MINPDADRPLHRQVADAVRAQIISGQLTAGMRLPAESRMAYDYGVGANTIRRALVLLEREGLIVRQAGTEARVRGIAARETIRLPRGCTLEVRMPTPAERRSLGVGDGVPIVVVSYGGGHEIYPWDRAVFKV